MNSSDKGQRTMRAEAGTRVGFTARCLLSVATAALMLVGLAGTANAAEFRPLVGELSQFVRPEAVTLGTNDDVWISDVETGVVHQLSPYPSNEEIGTESSHGYWGGNTLVHTMAVSDSNGFFYAGGDGKILPGGGSCQTKDLVILDRFGELYSSFKPEPGVSCEYWVAVDNDPQSDGYGRLYVWMSGTDSIQAFDGYGNPVNFAGTAPYISGNEIKGTPSGNFQNGAAGSNNPQMSGITVDNEGNIWINDSSKREVDEFDSSGVFVQGFNEVSAGIPQTENPNPKVGTTKFGEFPGLNAIAVDPTNGHVLVTDKAGPVVDEFSPQGKYLGRLDGSETPPGEFELECEEDANFCRNFLTGVAVDSNGYVYVTDGLAGAVYIYGPRPKEPRIEIKPETAPTETGATVNAVIDPNGGGPVTVCEMEWGTTKGKYNLGKVPCTPDPSGGNFTSPTAVHAELSLPTAETTYHYRFLAKNAAAEHISPDVAITPHKVLGLRTEAATNITSDSATIHGSFVGNGSATNYWFEYGPTTAYGTKVPLPAPPGGDAGSPSGPNRTELSQAISGLEPVTRYHYRIVAENGSASVSADGSFRTLPVPPEVSEWASNVHSNEVMLNTQVNPGGADTVYTFEYGTAPCSSNPCTTAFPDTHIGSGLFDVIGSKILRELDSESLYYYRVVATNSQGVEYGPDQTFSTFGFVTNLQDSCPNTLARQQTEAALITDCRAYELVSAPNAGGYDVESTLVQDQEPFDGAPRATDPLRVLYGVDSGAIPGVEGFPANRGIDPYVATRSAEGWSTSYVGIPSNNPFAASPFGSTLLEADSGLSAFAFGGEGICSPCFADGSTGIPIRLPNGALVQGMHGSIAQPTAKADGLVRQSFSADGTHFVFSSTSRFEPDGNNSTGDVSIYDRNLVTDQTQVVSTDHNGNPLSCLQGPGQCHGPGDASGIAELGISGDGSRILTGQRVGSDAAGNDYFHLYLHIGTQQSSVDLMPSASAGSLVDGMTADGSKVFVTTVDPLLGTDTDSSADIYEISVSEAGAVSYRLLSTRGGTPSNDDSCTPSGSPNSWNSTAGSGACNAVAFAGGAGLATESGTFFFLSPELLSAAAEADGQAGEPNLYVVKPGGNPEFVATIDNDPVESPAVIHAVQDAAIHDYGDFQVTPSGRYAVFATTEPLLAGFDNGGNSEVYRYDTSSTELDCASCTPSNAKTLGGSRLAPRGLSIADDGRVFFDSDDQLALRDADNRRDVYEWEESGSGPNPGGCVAGNPNRFPGGFCISLISSGKSPFDSGLLSATADGKDVFFFTHDILDARDLNGPVAKIYDARTEGGFFSVPPEARCVASDECHGPGTVQAPSPPVRTESGTAGNARPAKKQTKSCKKGQVKKKGKCVPKKRGKHRHKRHGKSHGKGRG